MLYLLVSYVLLNNIRVINLQQLECRSKNYRIKQSEESRNNG